MRVCGGRWWGVCGGGGLSGVGGCRGAQPPAHTCTVHHISTSISCSIYETSFVNNFLINNERRFCQREKLLGMRKRVERTYFEGH